ncbi:muconate cycloisomerase family protein [Niveispirillum sp. BGYR6]|uniref:muconate cycloisomerase family protein n=1 Tax=Niveispirillum sp. BGYR6 TaxID=2971249 RepID=UPI0022B9CC57|nr:muconate cycloisomerase family protein [Niveispirillum sp. BGYR6]MDG5496945.1 muconate cycloisomerase family protein [Niveispirillum sp. BGYR6]
MSKIVSIDTCLVDLPTIRPHVLAMATMQVQTLVIVRIRTQDGVEGIGEATTIGGLSYGPESPEGIKLTLDHYIAPLLLGHDASRPALLMDLVGKLVVGNHFAKCAVETALLDAAARRAGLPLSDLLGGRRRDSLPVAWTLASGDTGKDIEEAERMLAARRHNIFKLKIGKRAVAADVAHVAAIKAALGDRASVRVDVNQAWDEPTAARGMALLEQAGCDLVEQPVAGHLRGAMARLSQRFTLAVMADEGLTGPASAFAHAAEAAADVFSVKIQQSGGLYGAARVGAIADAAGIGLYGGTMLEGGVATAASAQLFACFPQLSYQTELFGPLLLVEDILAEPLTYADFALTVPTGPGLGIRLDEDKLSFHRRDADRPRHHILS